MPRSELTRRAGGAPRWRALAAEIERTATALGRDRAGRFAIEGLRLHERALRAGIALDATLVAESFHRAGEREARLAAALVAAGGAVVPAPDAAVERLVAGRGHGAVVSLAPLPEQPDLGTLLRPRGGLLLALDDVEDPGNVGALVRTALAAGARAVLCCGISDPFHPRAVRTSMGSLFRIPISLHGSATELADALRAAGATSVGAAAQGGVPLPEFERGEETLVLWIGSEAFGLAAALVERFDARVTIPMPPDAVDSFSVNAAGAILLYALARRSGAAPGRDAG